MVEDNSSPQLYDEGEERWEIKLHLGCGNIYLEGYWNIDAMGYLVSERPDLVRANATVVEDYYGRRAAYTDIHHIPPRAEYVVDYLDDMVQVKAPMGKVGKILCVQAFEHLRPADAERALTHWHELLRDDGVLLLSVPDTAATVEMLLEEETRDFAIQHLAGTRKDKWSVHYCHYTEQTLWALLVAFGFGRCHFLDNFHRYPAVVVRARKQGR